MSARRRGVGQGPAAGRVDAGDAVGADRPAGLALPFEHLVVHVLVHVEDGVDVEAGQESHGRLQVGDVAIEDGLAELLRVARLSFVADGRVVGRRPSRLEPAPRHAQTDDVEPKPGHERGVGGREVPGPAGIGIELVGRELVHGVHPVEEHHPPPAVVEVRTARRAQRARDGCGLHVGPLEDRPSARRAATWRRPTAASRRRQQHAGDQDEGGWPGRPGSAIHGAQSGGRPP